MNQELDLQAVSKSFRRIAWDPITWLPFLPIAAAYAFLGAPWWLCFGAAITVSVPLLWWWSKQWQGLIKTQKVAIFQSETQKENQQLQKRLADNLHRIRPDHFGTSTTIERLNQVTRLKAAIETAILQDNQVTSEEWEIARMVSGLCQEIAGELDKLTNTSQKGNQERILAILKGLETLERTHQEIHTLLHPIDDVLPESSNPILNRAERLQNRLVEAEHIRRRLERDLQTPPELPSPQKQDPV